LGIPAVGDGSDDADDHGRGSTKDASIRGCEEDFYVIRALAAIADIDTGPRRLVFGAGFKFDPKDPAYRKSGNKTGTRFTGYPISRRRQGRVPCVG
jgi:hypothetical protein